MINDNDKKMISRYILQGIEVLQSKDDAWVHFTYIAKYLREKGVQYKDYGYEKFKFFLQEFDDILEMKEEREEGKPPVYYGRKKGRGSGQHDKEICTTEGRKQGKKPPLKAEKSMLMALGYAPSLSENLTHLWSYIGRKVEWDDLNARLKSAYENGDIFYVEYGESGDPVIGDEFSEAKTVAFGVSTGLTNGDGETLYAEYWKEKKGWKGVFFGAQNQVLYKMSVYKIGALSFKNYSDANEFITKLHGELLPGETWNYAKSDRPVFRKKTEFEILENYLATVSKILVKQYDKEGTLNYGKIKFSNNQRYALFNSGLLSRFATDVIIVGEVYRKRESSDKAESFVISNPGMLKRGITELMEKGFKADDAKRADMPGFFEKVSQVVYDATAEIDVDDFEKLKHCIEEGLGRDRFPKECKERYERGDLAGLTEDFKKAIDTAKRIARRNYKYVVPQYREGVINFLMPIYMTSRYDEAPDFALVLSEQVIGDQKFYKPETVLELAWAYNNARVICKPDDTWLSPAKIEGGLDMEEEDEDYE